MLTVLIHVSGLALLGQAGLSLAIRVNGRDHPRFGFMLVLGGATLCVTCLHGIEVAIWASAYRILGALPDLRSSVLYSLNAMTSYGLQICLCNIIGS